MASHRVAVVTGANKGLGFGIVRALCKQFDGDVYLTARDVDRGKKAVSDLEQEGLSPKFHQLDITDTASIGRLKQFLQDNYGGLDVLVNNAAIAYRFQSTVPFSEQAENSLRTNFWGTLEVCKTLFPILKPHARVVNISSMSSQTCIKKCKPEIASQFKDPNITIEKVEELLKTFIECTKKGTHEEDGWPNWASGVAKIGVTVVTFIQQKQFDKDLREDLIVNCCCPGHINTDMSNYKGTKTIDEGAETPVYLALLPPNSQSPKGEFLSEKKVVTWGE